LIKVAFFVEGQTEQLFVEFLLMSLIAREQLSYELYKSESKEIICIKGISSGSDSGYFFIIVDSGQDEAVKSDIIDRSESLKAANYSHIIGLRDLHPFPFEKLSLVKKNLRVGLQDIGIAIDICLSIMETEAWFLGEEKHFTSLNSKLTPEYIESQVGFNPLSDDPEMVSEPAKLLKAIYNLVNLGYKKAKPQVIRTLKAIDYNNLTTKTSVSAPHFGEFLRIVESAVTK
jgi:hypothetical protein